MPYFPIAPGTDNRRAKALQRITLRNCMIEPAPLAYAPRTANIFVPTPGRTLLATLPVNVRGLFCEPGVQSAALFAAAGSSLYKINVDWSFQTVGAIGGGDNVTMRPIQSNMMLRSAGVLYQFDGVSLTQVTDSNAPTNAQTMAVVANRVCAGIANSNAFRWSKAALPLTWDPIGIAANIDLPGPVVAQENVHGDLWSFQANSTQPWQATGGTEDVAFQSVAGVHIRRGLIGREAIAAVSNGSRILIGDDRVVYSIGNAGLPVFMGGYSLQAIPYRDLETALQTISDSDMANAILWSYKDGSKEYCVVRTTLDRAFVYDVQAQAFHERTLFGASQYDLAYSAKAYGKIIVASPSSGKIWALDSSAYSDAGTPIERVMTIAVPCGRDITVNRLVFDMQVRNIPNSGQGSAPLMMVDFSMDGGETYASETGNLRTISLPTSPIAGAKFRVQDFCFGMVESEDGFLLNIKITDPFRFAFGGVWVNPTDQELP